MTQDMKPLWLRAHQVLYPTMVWLALMSLTVRGILYMESQQPITTSAGARRLAGEASPTFYPYEAPISDEQP